MLRLTREELAAAAAVAVATLADFEVGRRQPHPRTIAAIRAALEAAGAEFISENGGGAGVRLRKPVATAATVTPAPMSDSELAATGLNRGHKRPKGQTTSEIRKARSRD